MDNMNYITLDFETYDPNISLGLGSGWPTNKAKFLCAATECRGQLMYHDDINRLKRILENDPYDSGRTTIIAHNAMYEAGILHSYGFDITSVTFIDTMILAKLFYNNLLDFSLDGLAKLYLGETKDEADLGDIAQSIGIVKNNKNPVKAAKENMDKIFAASEETVKRYVMQDTKLCATLYKYFMFDEEGNQRFTQDVIDYHSDLIKALVLSRARGIRVHIPTAHEVKAKLTEKFLTADAAIKELTDCNINSSKQLAAFFDSQGEQYDLTEKGNPAITKAWMETSDHPLCKSIIEAKKYQKLIRDFIDPVLELVTGDEEYVRVYPEFKIYGAAATGRMSCANPNLQQVPKRSEDGELIRTMYQPEDGFEWYSLDFSSQEPRLQVHYGAKLGAPGAAELVKAFKENPKTDLHQRVADLANITRREAKTINLGLSYGMGDEKLGYSLGLTYHQAKNLRAKFNQLVPFLQMIVKHAEKTIGTRGYLKTLGGRKLYNEPKFERKAFNKLIQGGAADQTNKAVVDCYRAGIIPALIIHDSIELTACTPEQAELTKVIMETGTQLLVPSISDIQSGDTWGGLE